MKTEVASFKLNRQSYVIVPREEFERISTLAKVAEATPMPKPDPDGNLPAVDYARASLARNIVSGRVKAGLTQRELAKRAGIRFETLCRLEHGRHTPSVATVTRIEQAFAEAGRKRKAE